MSSAGTRRMPRPLCKKGPPGSGGADPADDGTVADLESRPGRLAAAGSHDPFGPPPLAGTEKRRGRILKDRLRGFLQRVQVRH